MRKGPDVETPPSGEPDGVQRRVKVSGWLCGREHVAEDARRNAVRFRGGDVSVEYRGTYVSVAESFLHEGKVRSVAQQVACVAVLQNVRIESTFLDARQFSTVAEEPVHLLARQARAFARGEQKDRAVTVTAFAQPSSQHQLLV